MSRKTRVPYVPMAVDYWLDHALAEVFADAPLAEVMWCRLLSAAKKSKADGFVPRGAVLALGLPHWKRTLPLLVAAGVVEEVDGGWFVRSWLKHNDTQDEIAADLERKRLNIQKWREKKRGDGAGVAGNESDTSPASDAPVVDRVTDYVADYVPDTNRVRHLTPDTRHLTPDSPNGTLGVSLAVSSPTNRKKADRKRDPLVDALARVDLGSSDAPLDQVTGAAWKRAAKAASELRPLDATPDEVYVRAGRYRRRWPDRTLSGLALASHWAELATDTTPAAHRSTPSTPVARQVAAADAILARIAASDGIRPMTLREIGAAQ